MALQPAVFRSINTQKQSFLGFFNQSTYFSPKINFSINKQARACLTSKSQQQEDRRVANFPPTVWGDRFSSLNFNDSKFEWYERQVKSLRENIAVMLDSAVDFVEKIVLIDSLCRLGVSYHFEETIEEQLECIFNDQLQIFDENDYDLYTVSLAFRVLRQHGFKMSTDVFNKFKDTDGKFKSSLLNDAKGLLSLYEATHLSIPGEDILDEAYDFSKAFLQSSAIESFPDLKQHITNALEQPYHNGIPRLEARKFIDLYQNDESRNDILLEFAKLDFNRVQFIHQQEINHYSGLWKKLDLKSEIPYARDRMAEIFFWASSTYFEPKYAHCRMIIARVVLLISLVDDTIDAYATIDEIHRLADAVERWDISCLEDLPDYMKRFYTLLLNTFSDFEKELKDQGKSYSVKFGKEAYQELVRGYYLEAKWLNEGKVPSFDEYMYNGSMTTGLPLVSTVGFMGVEKIKGTEEFDWLKTYPKLSYVSGAFIRLVNDLTSHKTEQARGHVASCIDCYMKQHGVTKEIAVKALEKMARECWKEMNEEVMRPTQFPVDLLMRIVNLVRLTDVSYKYGDGYTDSQQLRHYVKGLFVDPIPL
ncbi:casbene synthase, chloroplastic-like [Euphorbia lathyris]|uniref:Casbene synthase n=2 Tax=Euphorbia lathyris TaxID=212925 RepID=A0A165U5Z3_EUPLT|nr:casbene synthase [Euphorbia lathyris]